jgi:LacI family transcriptional regulator
MRTVVLPIESSRASGRNLLNGIAKYSRLHGPWIFYWEPGGLDEIFPRMKNLNADGIIMRDSNRLDEILNLGLPVVIVSHHLKMVPELVNIVTDSVQIGRMAADHLLGCGFKDFAYCGVPDKPWSAERCVSFCNRIADAGYKTETYPHPAKSKNISWGKEQEIVMKWLQSLPKPCGLMACNDDRSQQVLQACKLASIKVPEELALIGVDNDELICELSAPPMSSVSVNFERAGYEGASALDRMMKGKEVKNRQVSVRATHVVPRMSTDITAIHDSDTAEAVRFIRQHARSNLSVDDVVKVTTVSRRVLEKKFRKYLGRTIMEEIRRIRTNQIARMLIETNMSICEVALSFGFLGTEHIARYFQKEKGMSLLAYRARFGHK